MRHISFSLVPFWYAVTRMYEIFALFQTARFRSSATIGLVFMTKQDHAPKIVD